ILRIWKRPVVACFQTSSSASSLKRRTTMGEYFGIFFCRSSESSSGGSSFVALVGNRLLFSPRHVTGVNPAAKAAVSTNARSTVARIIAVPPTWNLSYLEPVVVAFVRQTQMGAGADEVRAYRQPQDRQSARSGRAALTAWTCRQGDRIKMPFAAAHESVHGTFRE